MALTVGPDSRKGKGVSGVQRCSMSTFLLLLCGMLSMGPLLTGDDARPVDSDNDGDVGEQDVATADRDDPYAGKGPVEVYVVPIEGPIDTPQLYILRRALKLAIENDIDAIVLRMDTPGGALRTTLDMMEALERFGGRTITFVDRDAISAGSYIAVATDDIYFAPHGMMGAAAVVMGTGEEVDQSMKQKIDSVMRARVRVLSRESRYRADVQRAMMDADFELEIDGEVIKPKGELLTLTADEAVRKFGDPPEPLLARGIAETLEELLDDRFGEGNWNLREFELTWSEQFAKWLRTFVPLLLGAGFLLLFIEFKTPGFGVFGILGICALLVVFASNYVAGLAGYEPVLLFFVGLALLAVEVLILPGIMIAGLVGILCVIAALVWSLADIWPAGDIPLNPEIFITPLGDIVLGLALAILGGILLLRFLPKSWVFDRLVLAGSVGSGGDAVRTSQSWDRSSGAESLPEVDAEGAAVTGLFPSGMVEIDGHRYHARAERGTIDRGDRVRVVGHRDFTIIVRKS